MYHVKDMSGRTGFFTLPSFLFSYTVVKTSLLSPMTLRMKKEKRIGIQSLKHHPKFLIQRGDFKVAIRVKAKLNIL